jgi:hypothetical protein
MQPVAADHSGARASGYFSFGALVGSVFAGLWVGGTAVVLLAVLLGGSFRLEVLRVAETAAFGALLSLLVAAVCAVPVSIVLAAVVFPLASRVRGRLLPAAFNAAILGAFVPTLVVSLLLIFKVVTSSAEMRAGDLLLIIASLAGGATAGVVYRALLVYRNPEVLTENIRSGRAV